MRRRALLLATVPLLVPSAARAEAGLREAWLGTWRGPITFRRSLPLIDIYPPPSKPHVEIDDRSPIGFDMTLAADGGRPTVRTCIDGGPMRTAREGETLAFAAVSDGIARLAQTEPRTAPHHALLTVRPDAVGTEALFRHSDGSFWRRHINLRFMGEKAEVILWVFDAEGTRARTWCGEARQR